MSTAETVNPSTAAPQSRPMPKVTLYVKDSDAPTWERARALVAGGDENSLSAFVTEALALHVDHREQELQADKDLEAQMETQTIRVEPQEDDTPGRTVRFSGAFVYRTQEFYGTTQAVYITRARKIVLVQYIGTTAVAVDVYPTIADLEEIEVDPKEERLNIIRAVADALSEEFIEDLD